MKYAVVSYNNFGSPEDCVLFHDYKKACAYLHWYWEDYMNDEIANGSHLVEEHCWHEDEEAKITWDDRCEATIVLIRISKPLEEFEKVDWEGYTPDLRRI